MAISIICFLFQSLVQWYFHSLILFISFNKNYLSYNSNFLVYNFISKFYCTCCLNKHYYFTSAFVAVSSSQLIAIYSAECSLCRPPSWSLLPGHLFIVTLIIAHLQLSAYAYINLNKYTHLYIAVVLGKAPTHWFYSISLWLSMW